MQKTAVVIGASSGIGKEIALSLAEQQYNLVIASRDERTLLAIKQDLQIRHGVQVFAKPIDLIEDTCIEEFVKDCVQNLGHIDDLFVTVGVSLDEDNGINSFNNINKLISINYRSIVLLINEFAEIFNNQSGKSISVISSIAAHAPRTQNLVYASAKSGLETFCLGLRHFLSKKDINVNIIALGYADTSLAYGKKLLFPKASPANVASFIVKASKKNKGLIFYPSYWRLITFALGCVPWFIYKRLSF